MAAALFVLLVFSFVPFVFCSRFCWAKPLWPGLAGLEDVLTPDVLEYRRGRGVIIQGERLGFVIEDDLGGERRLALSQSFGVHLDFDKRERVVGWRSGCHRFPTRRTCAEAPIRREDDAFAAIRQGGAIGVLNRIP